jgi:MFS transporter, DHA2 family, multidrug resistance protein
VDLSLFRSSNFSFGATAFCLGYAVFFGNNLLLPLWLQTRMGYIATWAGLVAAPSGLVAVMMTPFASRLLARVDARIAATLSMLAFALSYAMRSGYTPDANFGALVLPLLVQGVAMSAFFLSMITISLNGVPHRQIAQATGLSNFARITAGSFAASLAATVWERFATVHQTRLAEATGAGDPAWQAAVNTLHGAGLTSGQPLGALAQAFENQAYMLSTLDFFRISAWLSVAMVPLIWLTKRATATGGPPPAD